MIRTATRRTVVIAGNPNTGKTTLFNQLTGGSAKVGNYPGVTVERHEAEFRLPDLSVARIVDCPGTYSLSARSREEQLALQAISGLPPLERPDLVVLVVDATQLERNLYLALQVIELAIPVVIALNMCDQLDQEGLVLDDRALEQRLGVPVVRLAARSRAGVDELGRAIAKVLHDPARGRPGWRWVPEDDRLESDVSAVAAQVPAEWAANVEDRRRALALWALLSVEPGDELIDVPDALRRVVNERHALAESAGRRLDHEIIAGRYRWIDLCAKQVLKDVRRARRVTDRVDRVLLHPAAGFLIFLVLMTLVFQALFTGAEPFIGWIETFFAWFGERVGHLVKEGLWRDFVVNGLIGGVGAFVVFLPQIVILFLAIGIMEDTGYMARVAVLMDRVMKSLRLHGRAFVPMLSAYACAVPAILATRTMERRRDRLVTMMVIPLMTCSARLPVYGLMIAAMVPVGRATPLAQGLLMSGMYLFGTVMALACALVLGRTVFKGPHVPLLIEMPPYRMPHWTSVFRQVREQARQFVEKAGTIILFCSIAMWLLLTFPRHVEAPDAATERAAIEARLDATSGAEHDALAVRLAELDARSDSEQARGSFAGRLGRVFEPALAPLGFDWRIGIGIIGAFAAREVFVSTMGVVYGAGKDQEEDDDAPKLRERMQEAEWPDGRKVFTPLTCLSLMIFFALACQCMSTLAVVKRESGGYGWPLFLFAYMTALAWAASFVVFRCGRLLGY